MHAITIEGEKRIFRRSLMAQVVPETSGRKRETYGIRTELPGRIPAPGLDGSRLRTA